MTADRPTRLSALILGWIFMQIGATAFGGLGATLTLIEHELVDKRKALTRADITEALTYTKLLPGSTVVQVVSYLGYKLAGWPGSALSTAAFILPAALGMLLLSITYVSMTTLPGINPAINGLTAAIVGVLLATTYRLGKANISEPLTMGIALAALGLGVFLNINAVLIVVVAGLIGITLLSAPAPGSDEARKKS